MGYQYRGTTFVEDNTPVTRNGCGTYAGYRAHKRNGEDPCQDCRDSHNAYQRDRYQRQSKGPATPRAFNPDKCGTVAGYKQHQRHNQPTCDQCKAANAAYRRANYHATKAPLEPRPVAVFNPSACGTHNGYERHRRSFSIPCEPCRAAHTEYHRAYRAERKAA